MMDGDWLPDQNNPEDFHKNFQTDYERLNYNSDQPQNNSNGKRVVWTNAQIRTLLRAISGAWNGLFQNMLEDLSKEEKRQKTRELGQGWSVVHKMFLKEYPDSNLTTKQLAEKFRKLVLPPGSSKRSSVAELMVLHQGSALDPSKEVRLNEVEGLTGDINVVVENIIEQDNSTIDDQDLDFDAYPVLTSKKSSNLRHRKTRQRSSVPKEVSRDVSDFIKSDSLHLDQHNQETISTNCDILKKRKHELELEILELEKETQLCKAGVYEIIRGRLEQNEYDLSALLALPDNIALG